MAVFVLLQYDSGNNGGGIGQFCFDMVAFSMVFR
jgi:hypothetical protein